RADGGRRGVELRDLVTFNDVPEPVPVGEVGRALVHQRRHAVGEDAVDDVAVPGDPAEVGGAPVDLVVVRVQVEDVLAGQVRLHHVPAGGVHDALGLAGGPRGVEDEGEVLGVHGLGVAFVADPGGEVVPPLVAAVL